MDKTIPWTEKYRPQLFEDIISHDLIKDILNKFLINNKLNNLILYGPPGIGKTTLTLSLLQKIYGPDYKHMILELNGSDDRGINIVRDEIKNYASYNHMFTKKIKLVILDEVDSMTDDAQYALKEIIEIYDKNTKFILICNAINKIIYPLQSCCFVFRFSTIPDEDIKIYLLKIIKNEELTYTTTGLKNLIKLSEGDLRKSINYLQSTYLSYNIINNNNIYNSLGIPKTTEIKKIINNIYNKDIVENIEYIKLIITNNGYSLTDIIKYIVKLLIELDIDEDILINLLIHLSKIEYNIVNFGTNRIQLYSLISCLFILKDKNIIYN